MRPLLHRTIPLLLLSALAPATAFGGELRATVTNVKPEQGKLMVAVYESAESFKAGRRFAAAILHPVDAMVDVAFGGLPPGRYAVAVFQDLNRNETLDTNLFGVPTEPYGFSRDAAGSFGPPPFDAMAVAVDDETADTTVTLTP
ncbi:DUF2141 domain-containing protein [Azospirillum halopraeferens]|uniref:DUF2141 domain-containing protein n=1 Tax=Azospirillum halopraeferens TaxID=34010 RepID=UPI0003F51E68|nr:DUF2141 domain-containing protein [Azospirillum halopraeferens]